MPAPLLILLALLGATAHADTHAVGKRTRGKTATAAARCDNPFRDVCAETHRKPEDDFEAQGQKGIREALDAAVRAAGHQSLGAMAIAWLKADGLDFTAPPADKTAELEDDLFLDWYGPPPDPRAPPVFDPNKLLPKKLASCDSPPRKPGSPNGRVTAKERQTARAAAAQARELKGIAAALQARRTHFALYSELLEMCKQRGEGETPPAPCEDPKLRALRDDIVRAHGDGLLDPPTESGKTLRRKLIQAIAEADGIEKALTGMTRDITRAKSRKDLARAVGAVEELRLELCRNGRRFFAELLSARLRRLRLGLTRSKPFVRALEKDFLAPEYYRAFAPLEKFGRQRLEALFDAELAPRSKLTDEQKEATRRQIRQLAIRHVSPLPDDWFRARDGFPLPTWSGELPEDDKQFQHSPFLEEAMNGFQEFNAYYVTRNLGAGDGEEPIVITPLATRVAGQVPDRLRGLLFHEMGHKLDPQSSRLNGHDLRPVYGRLLQCFRDRFRMGRGQEGESVADWISARLLGENLATITDEAKRKKALMNAMTLWCTASRDLHGPDDLELKESHPHPLLRYERILGDEPGLRAVLGCPPGKRCTLDGAKEGSAK